MKKIKWDDKPKTIDLIRKAVESGVVLFPYRNSEILLSKRKENLPLPYCLLFSQKRMIEEVAKKNRPVDLIEKLLEKIFPAALVLHLGSEEYLTLASEPKLKKIFLAEEDLYFSELGEAEINEREIALVVESERQKKEPFTILRVEDNPFLLEKKGEVGRSWHLCD